MAHKRVVNIAVGTALYRGLQSTLERADKPFIYDGQRYVIHDIKPFKSGWVSVYLVLEGFTSD